MLVVAAQETQSLPDRFVTDRIPRPEDGEIIFVHMLRFRDFERFSASGLAFSSDDEPDVVRLVYQAAGYEYPAKQGFASATAYIRETISGQTTQAAFGEGSRCGLILDPAMIGARTIIFNGDLGRLGSGLSAGTINPKSIVAFKADEGDLITQLRKLHKNNKYPQADPRLRGNAFEARICGGIRLMGCAGVLVPSWNDLEAQQIGNLIARS
jgi:hypothetical protein